MIRERVESNVTVSEMEESPADAKDEFLSYGVNFIVLARGISLD